MNFKWILVFFKLSERVFTRLLLTINIVKKAYICLLSLFVVVSETIHKYIPQDIVR